MKIILLTNDVFMISYEFNFAFCLLFVYYLRWIFSTFLICSDYGFLSPISSKTLTISHPNQINPLLPIFKKQTSKNKLRQKQINQSKKKNQWTKTWKRAKKAQKTCMYERDIHVHNTQKFHEHTRLEVIMYMRKTSKMF